ncbi:MAG: RNA methyltransferase, partial [Alphaproteobacteria bacterium]
MTGGRGEGGAPLTPPPGESPIIVLVRPQMARNIGSTARAMANGGLFH